VVADTFLVAWRRLNEMPVGDGELPWLLAVARRALANQRRGRLRAARLSGRLAAEPALTRSDDEHGVLDALSRLRPLDREVLLLSAWEELSHRQIAEVFGCSENAVALRLRRARNNLAEELGAPTLGGSR
jgi:RNA polymerase sigma-70 factor (ECF subfamily)